MSPMLAKLYHTYTDAFILVIVSLVSVIVVFIGAHPTDFTVEIGPEIFPFYLVFFSAAILVPAMLAIVLNFIVKSPERVNTWFYYMWLNVADTGDRIGGAGQQDFYT